MPSIGRIVGHGMGGGREVGHGMVGETEAGRVRAGVSIGGPDIQRWVPEVEVGGGVRVLMADGPFARPDVQLDGDAHLDLIGHLQRNQRQLTIDHNTLTVEVADELNEVGYRCYRRCLWAALAVLGGASLLLLVAQAFSLWQALSGWSIYGILLGLVAIVLLVWYGGRRYSDPVFLQMFLLLGTTLPIVYGTWLLNIYTMMVEGETGQALQLPWTTLVLVMHMVLTQLYWMMMEALVTRLAAPWIYTRFMMLPQLMSYIFQYVIFGFTAWSIEFVIVLIATSLHNVLASTGLYLDAWAALRRRCVEPPLLLRAPRPQSGDRAAVRSFRKLLQTRYTMQVFAQDTIADLWAFLVIVWLVFVLWGLNIPIDTILPRFTVEPLSLRLSVLLFVRGLAWVAGQLVFRRKLEALSRQAEQRRLATISAPSLAQQLDLYLASLRVSAFQAATIRACYEEDAPGLFAQLTVNATSTSLAELLLLQIGERQWLLHPSLRKYFLYFHACIYFLLFIILNSTTDSVNLRYAWFRQSS